MKVANLPFFKQFNTEIIIAMCQCIPVVMRYDFFSRIEHSSFFIIYKIRNHQLLYSTSTKVYGQYARTCGLIIPYNHIAYVLDWVSIRIA